MTRKRSYEDACATAHALDLVGDRWAMLVVRELLLGPKRFTDLRTGVPDLSPNVLGQRLRDLETSGVITRTTLPPPAASKVYELTPWGHDLEPIVLAMGRWGARSPTHPRHGQMSVDAMGLALKADFHPAQDLDGGYEIRLGDAVLGLHVAGGRLAVQLGPVPAPVAVVVTDIPTLRDVLWNGLGLGEAEESGLRLDGDRRVAERLLAAFRLPAG